ncbi:SCO family protein [Azohydromonas sediminis]|uniref:SCO family protein n=1 Tax=Azohydromonas sediminis TaxID=2259674 RepID=UPI000E652F2A|nr:SCO family protein [Azohydromonas sediminis]
MAGLISRRAFGVAAALTALFTLAGCDRVPGLAGVAGSGGKSSFKAIDITGADYGRELSLTDTEGRRRTLADFRGKIVVLFFGFTHCPDVCPTTMVELAEAKRQLGADGERIQGIFVTIDPERDTPELLKAYVSNFDPSFVALRGDAEETKKAAREFKVFYAKVPGKTPDSYTMDHTAGSYVIDAQGRLRLFTRYGSGVQALVDDLKLLLAEAKG